MRKLTILFLLIIGHLGFSQNVRTLDPRQIESVPGEILIKLKDEVEPGINIQNGIIQSYDSLTILDRIGLKDKVFSSKILFSIKTRKYKTPRYQTGTVSKDNYNLNNLMKVKLKEEFFMEKEKLIEELNNNKEVEYAEPNYIVSIVGYTPESEVMNEEEAKRWVEENYGEMDGPVVPNDPLYSGQSNITAINADDVWETTKGDTTSVIAILDTGVDTEHPDLKDNIWTNHKERLGADDYDDDENGFDDDIHGWDFINNDNDPKDDNMHGTHVAGIAAAVGDNGKGIAGASWYAKIMPIKVFQSSGRGDAATISEGIEYAYQNGATILNMSFGTYSESQTMSRAAENAYAYATLVAAAGNDGLCIGPIKCKDGRIGMRIFPAAWTYVIGVDAGTGWSNFDQDGPIFSRWSSLENYEVKAPGTAIMSTVPNGGYRASSGTSMASPLVAGAIALYDNQKPDDSKELLFGNLINTSNSWIDIKEAIDVTPVPVLTVVSGELIDTTSTNTYKDGKAGAGETIYIKPTIKNYWGPTDSVFVAIDWKEFEDTSKAKLIDSVLFLGSVDAYAKLANNDKLLKLEIDENVANNVDIRFKLKVWSGLDKNYLSEIDYVVNVKNAIQFYGVYDEDITLYPNKEYLVSDNLIISQNAILTIEPGTIIKVSDGKKISIFDEASIQANGNKDSVIIFKNENISWGGFIFSSNSSSKLNFVTIEGIHNYTLLSEFPKNFNGSNLLFKDNNAYMLMRLANYNDNTLTKSNFYYNKFQRVNAYSEFTGSHLNIINNTRKYVAPPLGINYFQNRDLNYINTFDNEISFSIISGGTSDLITAYLGTADENQYRREVFDVTNEPNEASGVFSQLGIFNLDSISKTPYSEAHGIVWKILVNGKDAQDEYDDMDALGVGRHKFEVYFNRPMDTLYTPQVSMGVRIPYNQTIFTEVGDWSDDSTIYTIYHKVDARTADGINRIRVQDAKDPDLFDIPIEDSRFNVLVQAAGSLSSEFQATPGLGKISLEWKGEELTDHLGYNMYRYKAITDSTYSSIEQINTTLITDSTYVDYDVEPGSKYFYKYTMIRSNFTETDTSKTVSTTPLTADLGDANGDFEVDILDVIHQINYILGSSPQPFIMEAADVNDDGAVNVLDVVGTVNLILNPVGGNFYNPGEINYISQEPLGEAELFWRGDTLFVDSPIPLAGLQLSFDYDLDYTLLDAVKSFESMGYAQDDEKVLMLYSLSGKKISSGITPILTKAEPGEVHVTKAVFSSIEGRSVTANYMGYMLEEIEAKKQSSTIFSVGYPNPTSGRYILEYHIPEQVDGVGLVVYDMSGKVIHADGGLKNTSGRHRVEIDLSTKEDGVYIAVLSIGNKGYLLKQDVKRIVKE